MFVRKIRKTRLYFCMWVGLKILYDVEYNVNKIDKICTK